MNRRKFLTIAIASVLIPATVIKKTANVGPTSIELAMRRLNFNSRYGKFGKPLHFDMDVNSMYQNPAPRIWEKGQREEYLDYEAYEKAILKGVADARQILTKRYS